MPYIKQENREYYDSVLNQINAKTFNSKGELEYCIYKLMKMYMCYKDFRYSTLHDTVYAAQHCADEFRRNYLDKRENDAKEQNGKIYPYLKGDE